MTYHTAFNTDTNPLVVDREGRIIGGNDWGTVDDSEQRGQELLEAGVLIIIDETSNASPRAQMVFAETRRFNERHEAARQANKRDLIEAVEETDPGLLESLPVGGDNRPAKSDLVEVVAEHQEIDVPRATNKATSRKQEA